MTESRVAENGDDTTSLRDLERILIVDDERGIRRMLTRILERDGYTVDEAADANEAREILATKIIDAVLCDVSLGGEDGLSLSRWIEEHHPRTPVLLVTGSAGDDLRDRVGNSVVGLILKPFDPAEIAISLRAALHRRAQLTNLSDTLDETERRYLVASADLEATQVELMKNAQIWEALVNSASIGVLVISNTPGSQDASARHRLDFANPRAIQIFGQPDISGTEWIEFFHEADRSAVRQLVELGEGATAQLRMTNVSGNELHLTARSARVEIAGASAVVISLEDVTELVATQHRLERQLTTDNTTGLPNRTSLAIHIDNQLAQRDGVDRRTTETGVLAINLAPLRELARVDGEVAYERIVAAIGARLRQALAPNEVLGRSGPATFAVAANGDRSHLLTTLPNRIMRALTEPFAVDGRDFDLDSLIGVALSEPCSTSESLIRDATLAAEHVEAREGVRVFNDSLRQEAQMRWMIQQAFRSAIEKDQLSLAYQPIVGTNDKRLVALEALSRWHHEDLGQVSPDIFVPIAEELGLIDALGDSVLRKVIAQLSEWNELQVPTPIWVSCNVAPVTLNDPGFADRLMTMMRDRPIAPSQMCLEVTEGSMLSSDNAPLVLERLGRNGFRIALDDFGTGFSSLAHLIDVKFDVLKLAGDLMPPRHGYDATAVNRRQVLGAVVTMAHSLRMLVVAEAVETEAQWREIERCGIDTVQGWAYSAAMSADDDFLVSLLRPTSAGATRP